MAKQKHIIKKQVIDLKLGKREDAFRLQESVRSVYYSKILNLLDDLFSGVCGEHEYWLLDKLELNFGFININNLDDEFESKLRECFFETIIRKLKDGTISSTKKMISENGELIDTAALPVSIFKKKKSEDVLDESEYFLEVLKFFITKGYLPWWAELRSKGINEIFETVLKDKPDEIKTFIEVEITQKVFAAVRIIEQFDDVLIKRLIKVLYPKDHHVIDKWSEELMPLLEKAPSIRYSDVSIPKELKIFLIHDIEKISSKPVNAERLTIEFIDHIGNELKVKPVHLITELARQLIEPEQKEIIIQSPAVKAIKSIKKKYDEINAEKNEKPEKQKRAADDLTGQPEIKDRYDRDTKQKDDAKKSIKENKLTSRKPLEDKKNDDSFGEDKKEISIDKYQAEEFEEYEEIFVSNAGLVLLNPYLPKFFETLNLTEENKFRSRDLKINAAMILQHIIAGEKKFPEYELPLNKLLCGLDLSFPIPFEMELTDSIKTECNQLLESVINNWKALKSTSVKGFRESFLKRDGKIEIRENDYSLKVEQKAHDILLDTLPWSISIIKYNWMKKPLYVEWR